VPGELAVALVAAGAAVCGAAIKGLFDVLVARHRLSTEDVARRIGECAARVAKLEDELDVLRQRVDQLSPLVDAMVETARSRAALIDELDRRLDDLREKLAGIEALVSHFMPPPRR